MPWRNSLAIASSWASDSPSSVDCRSLRRQACGSAAMSLASCSAAARALPFGTTWVTSPIWSASAAGTPRPVRIMSSARPSPTTRGSRTVPPSISGTPQRRVATGLGPAAVRAAHGLEVGAGAERATRAEQHGHGTVGVRVEVAERLGKRGGGRAVHRVAHLRTVQDDGRDRPAPLNADGIGSPGALRPAPSPRPPPHPPFTVPRHGRRAGRRVWHQLTCQVSPPASSSARLPYPCCSREASICPYI